MRTVVFVLVMLLSAPIQGAELLLPGSPSPDKGVFLSYQKAIEVLGELESCRVELPVLRDLVQTDDNIIKTQGDRILELGRENEDLRKLNQDAIAVAEKIKSSEPWYNKVLSAGKWIGLGILIGFAAGAASK